MNVYLQSLGCRLNWSEIETLARQFTVAGHTVVSEPAQAKLCILNTCAVTAQAERKTRHCIGALARTNPDARIAIIGCYPTLHPETSAELSGVAWVIPNAEKDRTVDIVSPAPPYPRSSAPTLLRTRAFVKVQDGCDNHCTYCVIRLLRGPARSRLLNDIVAEVRTLVKGGRADRREPGVLWSRLGSGRRPAHVDRHVADSD
jgi:threonylcarbamoyladenosine tRNA methylthiotransferase MtaB